MKLMGCFHRYDLYKSAREGYCPFLLEFMKNDEIVVSKDGGLDHWKRCRLRWHSMRVSINQTYK
jgi:hypothetical protein